MRIWSIPPFAPGLQNFAISVPVKISVPSLYTFKLPLPVPPVTSTAIRNGTFGDHVPLVESFTDNQEPIGSGAIAGPRLLPPTRAECKRFEILDDADCVNRTGISHRLRPRVIGRFPVAALALSNLGHQNGDHQCDQSK